LYLCCCVISSPPPEILLEDIVAISPTYVLAARRLELLQFNATTMSETVITEVPFTELPSTACLICAGPAPSLLIHLSSDEQMESLIEAIDTVMWLSLFPKDIELIS
jgi:hypothetical protein